MPYSIFPVPLLKSGSGGAWVSAGGVCDLKG